LLQASVIYMIGSMYEVSWQITAATLVLSVCNASTLAIQY